MSFKSAYKSQEIESRLKKGYYDDIIGRGFDGTKDELDARLAHASVCVFWNRVPDASDLSFQSGDVQVPFRVGDIVRCEEEGEFVFYQLYSIDEGNAVWKKPGGGSVSASMEKLVLNITSNQAQPDEALNGIEIHVKYQNNDKVLVYNGGQLTVQVPMNMTYTVEFPEVEGYAKPENAEYVAVAGDTREVSASYNTTIMTISVDSNQTDKSDINGINIVLSGSMNKTLTYTGSPLEQKVPTGKEVVITPQDVTGYKSSGTVTKTPSAATDSASFMYETEIVTVTLNADNGTSVNGQQVTINNQAYTYQGSPVSAKVPFDTSYQVSANAKSGYTSPAAQSFTANQASRSVTLTYAEIKRGVFILDTDGNLVSRGSWNTGNNAKAVGVAVLSDNCKFVISKQEAPNYMIWGSTGTPSGCFMSADQFTALQDFAGKANTDAVLSAYGTGATAANYCRNTSRLFPDGRQGYLPSLGEWKTMYDNKSEVTACMSLIGGTAFTEGVYWSSSLCSSDDAWILLWRTDYVACYNRGASNTSVRAVAAL